MHRLFEGVGPATRFTQGDIRNVGVDGVINGGNERGKVDVKAAVVSDETTSVHPAMGMEGVKW